MTALRAFWYWVTTSNTNSARVTLRYTDMTRRSSCEETERIQGCHGS